MKIVIHPKYERFASFVKSIPERFDEEGETIYKGRNKLKVFEVDGLLLNVKRYRVPSFPNRIIYSFFRPSKASRAYGYALQLLSKHFNTPEPVAYIHLSKGGLLHYSYFISLQSPYSRNMYEFGTGGLAGREPIIKALADYTAQLHEAGVYHKDYSPGNILFEEANGRVDFCLIDINRMRFAPVSIEKGCANFARLWGQEDMFRLLAQEYAAYRQADAEACLKWVLFYRNKFWKRYRRRHEMPFEY